MHGLMLVSPFFLNKKLLAQTKHATFFSPSDLHKQQVAFVIFFFYSWDVHRCGLTFNMKLLFSDETQKLEVQVQCFCSNVARKFKKGFFCLLDECSDSTVLPLACWEIEFLTFDSIL